jgi:hypothetical protein
MLTPEKNLSGVTASSIASVKTVFREMFCCPRSMRP